MSKDKVENKETTGEHENADVGEDKQPNKKPPRRFIKKVGLGIGAIFVAGLVYLGWLGFIPGLSNVLGANSPRDLGVRYSEADLQSFYGKTGQKLLDYNDAPIGSNGKKVIFANPKRYTAELTQEEITARINASNWAYMPVKNVQVRFGDNNRIEVSGNIDTEALGKFIPFIGGVGYSDADVQTGLDWLDRFSSSPAFYIDATGSILNNNLNLNINGVQIGRWSPPLDQATKALVTATSNALRGTTGLDVRSATFDDGTLNFDGTAPTTIYVKNR